LPSNLHRRRRDAWLANEPMFDWLLGLSALALLVYLLFAMLKPEKF
jgi:K+-transporting ATPase KdpF subunit